LYFHYLFFFTDKTCGSIKIQKIIRLIFMNKHLQYLITASIHHNVSTILKYQNSGQK
jgi:hypothetical protein